MGNEKVYEVYQVRAQDPQVTGPDEPSTWVQIEAQDAAHAARQYAADQDDINDGEIAKGDTPVTVEVRPLSPRPAGLRTSERYLIVGALVPRYQAIRIPDK